jgi:hypothetical protein
LLRSYLMNSYLQYIFIIFFIQPSKKSMIYCISVFYKHNECTLLLTIPCPFRSSVLSSYSTQWIRVKNLYFAVKQRVVHVLIQLSTRF